MFAQQCDIFCFTLFLANIIVLFCVSWRSLSVIMAISRIKCLTHCVRVHNKWWFVCHISYVYFGWSDLYCLKYQAILLHITMWKPHSFSISFILQLSMLHISISIRASMLIVNADSERQRSNYRFIFCNTR